MRRAGLYEQVSFTWFEEISIYAPLISHLSMHLQTFTVLAELEFSSSRRRMTVVRLSSVSTHSLMHVLRTLDLLSPQFC